MNNPQMVLIFLKKLNENKLIDIDEMKKKIILDMCNIILC